MKFNVTFKTPDAVEGQMMAQLKDEVYGEQLKEMPEDFQDRWYEDGWNSPDNEEFNSFREKCNEVVEDRKIDILEAVSEWVKYGECLTVQFDTEDGTAIVVSAKNSLVW